MPLTTPILGVATGAYQCVWNKGLRIEALPLFSGFQPGLGKLQRLTWVTRFSCKYFPTISSQLYPYAVYGCISISAGVRSTGIFTRTSPSP